MNDNEFVQMLVDLAYGKGKYQVMRIRYEQDYRSDGVRNRSP
jgi:hypothetical protein